MIKEKEIIVRLLHALFPDVKIYLFGSCARGTNRPTSAIDLALDAGHELSFTQIAQARNMLNVLYIPEKIDVVDIWSVPDNLKNTILREAKEWKS